MRLAGNGRAFALWQTGSRLRVQGRQVAMFYQSGIERRAFPSANWRLGMNRSGVWGCMYGGTDLQIFPELLVRQGLTASYFLSRTSHPHGAAHGIRRQRAWRAETVPACAFWQANFQLRVRRKQAPHPQQSGVPSAGAPKVTRRSFFEQTDGRALHNLGNLHQIEALELALALQNIRHIR